jgi:adenine deaminase
MWDPALPEASNGPKKGAYLPPEWRASASGQQPKWGLGAYELCTKIVGALRDAGAHILLGTDAMPFSIHLELALLVEAGLTPYEAIKAGTCDAAEFLNGLDEFGTVAIGRRADLILVEGNPLRDVANVARRVGVMVRGRWVPQGELQGMLERLAASYVEPVPER